MIMSTIWEMHEGFTGMPFVFARWVTNKKLDEDFTSMFNQSLQYGIQHLDAVIAEEQLNFTGINVQDYLSRRVNIL